MPFSLWMSNPVRIQISSCVHYCGFRYGCGDFNPYENYIVGLSDGTPEEVLRERFVDFIRYYRPRDLGQAIGVVTEVPVPLWWLPWKSWRKLWQPTGWRKNPDDVVDIITYFSEAGVRASRIREEFVWLERAWYSIRSDGYLPDRHSYITVVRMVAGGDRRYIVVDGNHRISALAALGRSDVMVREMRLSSVYRRYSRFWPLVLSAHVSYRDALSIFDGYFIGNRSPYRADTPAVIIDD